MASRGRAAAQRALALARRSLAADASVVVPATASPFTRYTSPVPTAFSHAAILGAPPTKARARAWGGLDMPAEVSRTTGADAAGACAQVTTLPSGLRVATETTPFAETASIGVWIDAGSRYETAASNGTAHFLEHMAFKGTKARRRRTRPPRRPAAGARRTTRGGVPQAAPVGRRSDAARPLTRAARAQKRSTAALEQEVEDLGAHLNAYTSREQTTYYAKVASRDVPKAVDILSDILQNSSLEAGAIERERGVILREMEEVEKESEEVLFDHLHATAFQFTALGRPILGSAANVRSITRDDLAKYIGTHYTAPRMVVVGAGGVEHEALVALAAAAFSSLPTGGASAAQLCAASPAMFTGSEVRMRDDDCSATHLALAVKGAAWHDPDSVALMVAQSLLGSWDASAPAGVNASSPLAAGLAANGLVDSFSAFNSNYNDAGLFGLYAVSSEAGHLDDMAWLLMKHFATLAYDVDEEQLLRAKEQLKSSLLLHLEAGSSTVAEEIGRQLLCYGRRIPRAEMFARIDAVSSESIKAVGRRFITDSDLAIAASGPTQYLPDYNWFTRRQYLNRY